MCNDSLIKESWLLNQGIEKWSFNQEILYLLLNQETV